MIQSFTILEKVPEIPPGRDRHTLVLCDVSMDWCCEKGEGTRSNSWQDHILTNNNIHNNTYRNLFWAPNHFENWGKLSPSIRSRYVQKAAEHVSPVFPWRPCFRLVCCFLAVNDLPAGVWDAHMCVRRHVLPPFVLITLFCSMRLFSWTTLSTEV